MKLAPTLPLRRRTALPIAAVLALVVGLAACGSDSDTSTGADSSSSSSTSSTSTPAPNGDAVITTADSSDLGEILVDADGMTVYTLTKDGAAVTCTGACLQAWPPVLLPPGTEQATGTAGVDGLAFVDVGDGKQVTVDGLPLYTFAGDTAAGDATGEGLASFGGVWKVVKVGGGASDSGSSSTPGDDGY